MVSHFLWLQKLIKRRGRRGGKKLCHTHTHTCTCIDGYRNRSSERDIEREVGRRDREEVGHEHLSILGSPHIIEWLQKSI